MIINIDKDKLREFLAEFEDAEEVGKDEYTVDLYDTDPALSLDIELTKEGVDVLAALFLEFDEEQEGWYLGEKTKDAGLIEKAIRQALEG